MSLTEAPQAVEPATTAARLSRYITGNWQFCVILAAALVLRLFVMLGYPPAMYFNDSFNYLTDAVFRSADIVRPDGYPLLIFALEPFHSLVLITALQALMGLAVGVGCYAVLRHRGLPWWGSTLPALPVLFDAFELQIEHMIAADALFTLCVTAAAIVLAWSDRTPITTAAAAGLLLGCATLTRSEGEVLAVVLLITLIVRRAGWQSLVAGMLACLLPVACYMLWFHTQRGQFALTRSSGTFLYSRVQSFAECSKMNPPPDLRVLCDPRPPAQRPGSQEYLWSNRTPLAKLTGRNNIYRFTPHIEKITRSYAELAIRKQPLDYARVVLKDTMRTFGWNRAESNLEGSGSKFRFESTATPVPSWVSTNPDNRAAFDRYGGDSTRVVHPWANLLMAYQKVFFLRGPLLLLILLLGLGGLLARLRGPGLFAWLSAAALIVVPPMTAGFSYRYTLAAVPVACLAAGLAFAGPGGGIIGWLREHGMLRRPAQAN